MSQPTTDAKLFRIAFRASVTSEATYLAYFDTYEAATFWPAVERAYGELVTRGEWFEPAFKWAIKQLLRHNLPLTRHHMERLHMAYKARVSPVYSLVPPAAPLVKAPVRGLVRDFKKLGERPVTATSLEEPLAAGGTA